MFGGDHSSILFTVVARQMLLDALVVNFDGLEDGIRLKDVSLVGLAVRPEPGSIHTDTTAGG